MIGQDPEDNELITLEIIHQFVEVLDRYFGNVITTESLLSLPFVASTVKERKKYGERNVSAV